MANSLFDWGRKCFLDGGISWSGDNIKAVLVDTADYTVDLTNHHSLADIPSAGRVATSSNFASKSSSAGVADAGDITFSAVTGDVSEAIVLYRDTGGAENTCELIAYIDSATGLPVTPNGGDITVTWDNGANKIFKL